MITSKHHSAMIQNIFSNHNVLCKAVLSRTNDQNKDFIVEKVKKKWLWWWWHTYISRSVFKTIKFDAWLSINASYLESKLFSSYKLFVLKSRRNYWSRAQKYLWYKTKDNHKNINFISLCKINIFAQRQWVIKE